jgi:uncharacterized ferritin-like protein (DUF455 family)
MVSAISNLSYVTFSLSVKVSNKLVLVADLLKARGVDIAPHYRLKKTVVGDKVVSVTNVDIKKYDFVNRNVFSFLDPIVTFIIYTVYTQPTMLS